MKSSNPALKSDTFIGFQVTDAPPMTLGGTINKSFFLISLVLLAAFWSWNSVMAQIESSGMSAGTRWIVPSAIGGFILALVIVYAKKSAPFLSPVYALVQGALLGAISATFEYRFPGIALQAILATVGTFIGMLTLYKTGIIKVTEKFRMGVVAATMGIAFVYLINFVLRFFGMNVPFIHESGAVGIGISVFIVIVAALNLAMDFDFIEQGVAARAPRFMEWYAAFSLLVTLVWLYLEMLRLISKARR